MQSTILSQRQWNVNFGDGTIGTEQRGYKVVVYRAVPKIFVMKPLI